MKTNPNKVLAILSGLALSLGLSLSPVSAQSPMAAQGSGMMEDKMMGACQKMAEQRKTMMAEIKAEDAALTEQVAKMNSAPEAMKPGLMADLITRMVEQRVASNIRMEKMQAQMMQHMMEHMKMGKASMKECPMMKGMGGMDDKAADLHKDHQEAQK
jgi:hypothetical protein